MYKRFFFLLIAFFVTMPTLAMDKTDAYSQIPPNINGDIHQFELIGKGTFSFLFWDVYQGRLLTTSGRYPVNLETDELIYQIDYLVKISRDELIQRTVEQWQHLTIDEQQYQKYLPLLKQIWPNVNENDQLLLLVQQNRSVFYFNQQYIGEISSKVFGQMFIDIWLSEQTSAPKFRQALLGESTND